MKDNIVLIEHLSPAQASIIVEEHSKTKHSYLSGIFLQGNIKNGNNRIYETKEISLAVEDINTRIKADQTVYGELNHPDNLKIDLNNVSHIITEMYMEGDNAFGKARIIEAHPKGQIVKAILQAGGKLGVSSRGQGNVVEGRVSDYRIVTVDVVATPSAPNAYPNHVMENINHEQKIITLAEAVIHDEAAQKYFKKELFAFFETMTGQQLRK